MRNFLNALAKKKRGRHIRIDKNVAEFVELDRGTERILIEYDMMLKGNDFKRSSGTVRQIAVTVNGSTRLVTSGEEVDRATYDELVKFRAIMPLFGENASKKETPDALVEDEAI